MVAGRLPKRMERGVIMTMVSRFKYYFNPIIICMSSVLFGIMLISNRNVTMNGVDLFRKPQDSVVGLWMIFFGTIKIISLFVGPRKLKKWALIGVMVGWSVISWGYLKSPIQNFGYILTITLTILCGSELYRGDYDERRY